MPDDDLKVMFFLSINNPRHLVLTMKGVALFLLSDAHPICK